jgi:hypothetical protein
VRSFTTCGIFAPCASREKIEDILHPDAHPADARAAAALVWVERDAIHGRKLNPHTGGSKGNTGCSRTLTPSAGTHDGIPGTTALHLCSGSAYVARDKPNRYTFLPELTASTVEQISISRPSTTSTTRP